MKKLVYIGALSVLLLTACGEEKTEPEEEKITIEAEDNTIIEKENVEDNLKDEDDSLIAEENSLDNKDKSGTVIDTSVFEHAINVEVDDARELTKHITLKIDLANDSQAGLGTLNVLTQTFDFLEQDDIKGADTIAILVRVNDIKVSQFTVHTAKFKPDDITPMADLVLAASDIDFVTPEVKSFGETMELWD